MTISCEANGVGLFIGSAPKVPLTLIRKQAVMASQILKRRELREQAEPPEPAGLNSGIALVPLPQEDAARCSCPSAYLPAHQQLFTEVAATTLAEPEESLVADPRGGLTPAQMVEQKVLALLQTGHPGLFIQAAGRRQDIRRIPGEWTTPTPSSRTPDATLE
jgi:hypothetical protein